MPMSSLAKMTIRRAMKRASSPASSMRASQYTAASGSEPRIDLMNALIDVVVVVAPVAHGARAERRLGVGQLDRSGMGQRGGDLQRREHLAAVAAAALDEQVDGVVGGGRAERLEPATDEDPQVVAARGARGGTASSGCAAAG